ncbi:uncharacterized protein B0H18DRAFT_1092989 [Fomitopsis serialis]|uniref:uncharacterized protein n=1 Tax=Fomitopsis serialis TaxID=139415 RepID=UPI00200761E3|nr:uncharacterized protein B0H18DRAFT_1092989 [Neoantrodia serialis]KAH9932855.1 hypothetical protein B0H18DRAFT_1092989 [Neoantrodia serialis]
MSNNDDVSALLEAMQLDPDMSPIEARELMSAFSEYMQAREPDERQTSPELKEANNLLDHKVYDEAHAQYLRVIGSILGANFSVPLPQDQDGGMRCDKYLQLSMDERVDLMECCNGVAKCLSEAHKVTEALDWYEEVDALYKNARFAARPAMYDWEYYNPQPPRQDVYVQRLKGLVGSSDAFVTLRNTGSATHRKCVADELIKHLPAGVNTRPLRAICPSGSVTVLMQFRHPDPQLLKNWELSNDDLQVRGSWQKMKISRSILPRMGFASFIWKSRLYVCGGMKGGTIEPYRDFYYMDLTRQPGTWRELQRFPRLVFLNVQLAVHDNKAYSFRGAPELDFFDLVTERWGQVKTRWVDQSGKPIPWPIPREDLTDYAMHIIRDGCTCLMGCNLLAVLDLSTKKWQHLSGVADMPRAGYDVPGPRKYFASWVDGPQENIYLLQGVADRAASEMHHQPQGAHDSHGYDDFWSWNIEARRWRREKMVGNVPCPRSEMGCTYNPSLNSAIVYGGYSPEIPTLFANSGKCYRFTYYADTFILDHSSPTPRWRHVVHQGFPTYRAQSVLLTDPDTGRMYLFGGYTNTDQVPSPNHGHTRSFGDVWQLRLDVPGGHFEEVNVTDDERNARMGPWQRCFSCGNTGMWRKCGGTCKGRAFFCDDACLKDGWREHKELHKCRKK